MKIIKSATILILFTVLTPISLNASRFSEAITNITTLDTYEETFFSENGYYISAKPNPKNFFKPKDDVDYDNKFDSEYDNWPKLGKPFYDGYPLRYQLEIVAGAYDKEGKPIIGGKGNFIAPDKITHSGRDFCKGEEYDLSAEKLGIPKKPDSGWFYVTAIADNDDNSECVLYVKVIDRPDLIIKGDLDERAIYGKERNRLIGNIIFILWILLIITGIVFIFRGKKALGISLILLAILIFLVIPLYLKHVRY